MVQSALVAGRSSAATLWARRACRGEGQEWVKWANEALTSGEVAALRGCVQRGTPYGPPAWVEKNGAATRTGSYAAAAEATAQETSVEKMNVPWSFLSPMAEVLEGGALCFPVTA